MKKILVLIIFIGFLFWSFLWVNALWDKSKNKINSVFTQFILKVDKNNSSIDKKIFIYKNVVKKIVKLEKKYSGEKLLIINFLKSKIDKKILDLEFKRKIIFINLKNKEKNKEKLVNESNKDIIDESNKEVISAEYDNRIRTSSKKNRPKIVIEDNSGTWSSEDENWNNTGSWSSEDENWNNTGTWSSENENWNDTGTGSSEDEEWTGTWTINNSSFLEKNTIIVRTPENFVHKWAAENHLKLFRDKWVKTIILLVKNDEDLAHMDSGETFYKSSIAPIAKDYKDWDFDALEYTINFAHNNNMKVYAWIPQFHDKVPINNNPDLQMKYFDWENILNYNPNNEYFLNPISEEVQNYQISIIEEVTENYDIDGIFIDWIRFDDYNMDFSLETRNKFQNLTNINPLEIDFTTDNDNRKAWNNFRQDEIAKYIEKVSNSVKSIKPDLKLWAFILPVEMKEVAQNPNKFEDYLDYIWVMLYNVDWWYPEEWIYNGATEDIKNNMDDDSKILAVLDIPSCENPEIRNKLSKKKCR